MSLLEVSKYNCSIPREIENVEGVLALTVLRSSFAPNAQHFREIENPAARDLMSLFFKVLSEANDPPAGAEGEERAVQPAVVDAYLETVMDPRDEEVFCWTIWALSEDRLDDKILPKLLAQAKKAAGYTTTNPDGKKYKSMAQRGESWMFLRDMTDVKRVMVKHLGMVVKGCKEDNVPRHLSRQQLDLHVLFDPALALLPRTGLNCHPLQRLENTRFFMEARRALQFPRHEYVFRLPDYNLAPSAFFELMLTDVQAMLLPPSASRILDISTISHRASERLNSVPERLNGGEEELELRNLVQIALSKMGHGQIKMKHAESICDTTISRQETFKTLCAESLKRRVEIDDVASCKNPAHQSKWRERLPGVRGKGFTRVGRLFYLEHQKLTATIL